MERKVIELNEKYQALNYRTGIFDMKPMVFRHFKIQSNRIVAVLCKDDESTPDEDNSFVISHRRLNRVIETLENGIKIYNSIAYGCGKLE